MTRKRDILTKHSGFECRKLSIILSISNGETSLAEFREIN